MLRGIRASLAPSGVAVWDVNTQAMYRDDFARTWVVEEDGTRPVLWRGGASPDFVACRDDRPWREVTGMSIGRP